MQFSNAASLAESSALGLHLHACVVGHSKLPARCGSFGVFEDRRAKSGRIISLNVVVLSSRQPSRQAIAEIPGGPGQGATTLAKPIADGDFERSLSALRKNYNIVFLDSRGMGGSEPFDCDMTPKARPDLYFKELFPSEIISACWKRANVNSNPALFGTNEAVDDLNDLRQALDYPKLVLYGGSYGTFFSLVFVRRHPEHVESAVLQGVMAPHFVPPPGAPSGAQAALDDLMSRCRSDRPCHRHFPDFPAHFAALLKRFDAGPILVPVRSAATKQKVFVALSKEVFVDRLRQILYNVQTASTVPFIVERSYNGDYAPLAQAINVVSIELNGAVNYGAFLSYSCSGEIPFVSNDEVRRQSERSFVGDLRLTAEQRACKIWNVPAMPAAFNDPVRSRLPILMIDGQDDPATPPVYARKALAYLPNGALAIIRGGGHITETSCTDRLIESFVQSKTSRGLDLQGCSAAAETPPFDTSMAGWPNP